ncbi:MAG: hypothetical protein CBC35_04895 [Planctomycetes bacterium TMED75]|nr:hypothetical protein [Planctomycetaceae bacterium]OUU93828.1 MAG: hypothetical protein CBC35_04895 [Planctomycetes bacterium TMED75]
MGCIALFLALFFPRVILVLIWLFGGGWLQDSFQTQLWPVLGFICMPLTTLAYAVGWHMGDGTIELPGTVLIVVAVLIDLGLLGGGTASSRRSGAARRA